jgi:hypothetical protein
MLKVSEATHPNCRPMTVTAAIAGYLETLKVGQNVFPGLLDDVRHNREVPIPTVRMNINQIKKKKQIVTRIAADGKLNIYLLGVVE